MMSLKVLDVLLMMEFLAPRTSESTGNQGLSDLKEINPEKWGDLTNISELVFWFTLCFYLRPCELNMKAWATFFSELGIRPLRVTALNLSSKPHIFFRCWGEGPVTLVPVSWKSKLSHAGGRGTPDSVVLVINLLVFLYPCPGLERLERKQNTFLRESRLCSGCRLVAFLLSPTFQGCGRGCAPNACCAL